MTTFYAITDVTIGNIYDHYWRNELRGYPVTVTSIDTKTGTITVQDTQGHEWPTKPQYLRPRINLNPTIN